MTAAPRFHASPLAGSRAAPVVAAPGASVLERNLRALARTSSHTAELLRSATPRADVEFHPTDNSALGCALVTPTGARALCSRRRPLAEAEVLAGQIDVTTTAAVAVTGFAAGHHVAALARKMKRTGVLVVFEPDIALLRAVLERIDCSEWLNASNTVILTDADDGAAMSSALTGVEGVVMMGLELLEHPPSNDRLGGARARFYENLTQVIKAVRTTVATTMVQVKATLRNLTMNIDRYAASEGIAVLNGSAAGRPGIVVSAGPSLSRNIALLERPGVREHFVIIAAQTVLKTLLARGIRPHFVTALDYADISARFYEGLAARDVEGVTLVVEPKANPAILEAFPGEIRCVQDGFLDALLGEEFAHPGGGGGGRGSLPAGATVAHLAYYLARYLGCDPVVLVGQDLGFTDGQYYAAGAAIHTVWSGELNEFRTLEMLEWERIKRMGAHLRPARDTLGRSMYTDEQMATYLVQFEREFRADQQRGLTTIDATEGGVAKAGTRTARLEDVLNQHLSTGHDRILCSVTSVPASVNSVDGLGGRNAANLKRRVAERVRTVRQGVWRVGDLSRRAGSMLAEMSEHHADQARVNRLIEKVAGLGKEVAAAEPAYRLVHFLNQTGTFNRLRTDRSINLDGSLSELERQRLQIERDRTNVEWLADAADALGTMLDECTACLEGAPKITRTPSTDAGTSSRTGGTGVPSKPARAVAMIAAGIGTGGLGTARDLARPLAAGKNALRLTLERLSRCDRLDGAVVLTEDPGRVQALIGERIPGLPVEMVRIAAPPASLAPPGLHAARLWAAECWRGGLGNTTCYDEALLPHEMSRVMAERAIDAALIAGADWCLIDPALCDEVIALYTPGGIAFAQAPPGIGPCVLGRSLMDQLGALQQGRAPLASIGGLLGYIPSAPLMDRIAPSPTVPDICARVAPWIRDCGLRAIPDSPPRFDLFARAMHDCGGDPAGTPSRALLEAVARSMGASAATPSRITLEAFDDGPTGADTIAAIVRRFAAGAPDLTVTIGHRADPLDRPDLARLVNAVRAAGAAAVHIRTDLSCESGGVDELARAAPDVVSVNVYGDTPASYRTVSGVDAYSKIAANLERLCSLRAAGGWTGWIVPRITRCDATYADIDGFYDKWLRTLGAAVIDPLPAARPGKRIAPLPLPAPARARLARTTVVVGPDGRERAWADQEG